MHKLHYEVCATLAPAPLGARLAPRHLVPLLPHLPFSYSSWALCKFCFLVRRNWYLHKLFRA